MSAFQILDECPACRVESAVAAVYDPCSPASMLGVAAESRCRLCGRRTRGVVEPACGPPADAETRTGDDICPRCGERLSEDDRLTSCCSGCGTRAHAVEQTPGARFTSTDQLEEALARWCKQEGHESPEEFLESSFLDGSLDAVFQRIQAGERVETNFDVLAFLFPEVAMAAAVPMDSGEVEPWIETGTADLPGSASAAVEPALRRADPLPPVSAADLLEPPRESPEGTPADEGGEADGDAASSPAPAAPEDRPPTLEQRTEAWAPILPLVSVMVADGRVHPAEQAFLNRVLARHRYPPIPAEHVRVHRPETVPVSSSHEARERMVEAMVHLVHVDRLRDGTEFRVVEEYARAWGVDLARVAHWDQVYRKRYSTGTQRLWLILESIFVKR